MPGLPLKLSLTLRLLAVSTIGLNVKAAAQEVPISQPSTVEANQYNITHQYGGNQGFYSIGFGYRYQQFEPSMSFGYSPPLWSSEAITQLNFKFNWELWRNLGRPATEWLMGFSLLMNSSPSTYFEIPKPYPNKYYPPNAYFFSFHSTLRHHNFYIEVSIIDYYLEVIARNSLGSMKTEDLISVGFGYLHDVDFQWRDLNHWLDKLF